MNPQHHQQHKPNHPIEPDLPVPPLPTLRIPSASTTTATTTTATPTEGAQRRIAIAVDLSDESAYSVKWALHNYLRPGDAVILLHVRPTSVLYGADWGSIKLHISQPHQNNPNDQKTPTLTDNDHQKLEDDFDNFTTTKANSLAQPLVEAKIPFKIHIVKDHDMKERLCLEVERLGLSAMVMGSRGFGATSGTSSRGRKNSSFKGRLGSVSDYCVHHCVCPVVVVRYPDEEHENKDEKNNKEGGNVGGLVEAGKDGCVRKGGSDVELQPVPEEDDDEGEEEEEEEYLDASDEH